MKAEKYVAHTAANPAEYGFDKPALRIKFTLTERKVEQARRGAEGRDEGTHPRRRQAGSREGKRGRFARLEGDDANPAVFVLAEATFKDLDKPALELLNKKLLTVAASTRDQARPDRPGRPADASEGRDRLEAGRGDVPGRQADGG